MGIELCDVICLNSRLKPIPCFHPPDIFWFHPLSLDDKVRRGLLMGYQCPRSARPAERTGTGLLPEDPQAEEQGHRHRLRE